MATYRLVDLTTTIKIAPMYINGGMRDTICEQLQRTVEGTISTKEGLILKILDNGRNIQISEGIVCQRTGWVLFEVKYRALVLCPRKDMVVPAQVRNCSAACVRVDVGPAEYVISHMSIPEEYVYDSNSGLYEARDSSGMVKSIGPNTTVRMRILQTGPADGKIRGIATLIGPGLGPVGEHRL